MQSRAEVTTRSAKAYVEAGKQDKGRIRGEVIAVRVLRRVWAACLPTGLPDIRTGIQIKAN